MLYSCRCDRPPSERPVFWERDGQRYCTICRAELVPELPGELDHLSLGGGLMVDSEWAEWVDVGGESA